MNRLIALDTETTGLDTKKGHRIIEIGCVEIKDRIITKDEYQVYIQPNRRVGDSVRVHGITDNFLKDKPIFPSIASDFLDYITHSSLIIHNAAFDIGFLNQELNLAGYDKSIADICPIIDTMELSKKLNPSSQHNLNALARRHEINIARELHGALLDAQILAEVYLAMTGGQGMLFKDIQTISAANNITTKNTLKNRKKISVIYASDEDKLANNNYFKNAT